MTKSAPRILLAVTGSIAAFKAAALASKLSQEGYEVRVVLTKGAREFVGEATFEGLTGSAPLTTGFESGSRMNHIHWARWADLTLVYPASANTITRLSHGDGSDLLGMLFLAHDFRHPFWIAPAMNPAMLAHPAVAEALGKLSRWGVTVFESGSGRTACGEIGAGRLAEPEEMLEMIRVHFAASPGVAAKTGKRILVTAGGTSEKIDEVRVLTNTSTGATGVAIARELADSGHRVTLLLAEHSAEYFGENPDIEVVRFSGFADLERELKDRLARESFDTVIHAAAVSDYSVESIATSAGRELNGTAKIHSGEPLVLKLKPNPKIVNRLRQFSRNPGLKVISFKLTVDGTGRPDFSGYDSDLVVHNDLRGIARGTPLHAGAIYLNSGERRGELLSEFETKQELTRRLAEWI